MYGGVIGAMQTGSVRDLDEALERHLPTYIRAGTYLVLEKLRFAVMRRLLKRTLLLSNISSKPPTVGWTGPVEDTPGPAA